MARTVKQNGKPVDTLHELQRASASAPAAAAAPPAAIPYRVADAIAPDELRTLLYDVERLCRAARDAATTVLPELTLRTIGAPGIIAELLAPRVASAIATLERGEYLTGAKPVALLYERHEWSIVAGDDDAYTLLIVPEKFVSLDDAVARVSALGLVLSPSAQQLVNERTPST